MRGRELTPSGHSYAVRITPESSRSGARAYRLVHALCPRFLGTRGRSGKRLTADYFAVSNHGPRTIDAYVQT